MKAKYFNTALMLAVLIGIISPIDASNKRSYMRQRQYPQAECCPTPCPCPCSSIGIGPGYGKQDCEMPMGYSAPARINPICGWDFFVSGSFIYWHVNQEGMDVAYTQSPSSPFSVRTITQESKYKPGFKVAIGTSLGHDNWMGTAEYTRLHMTTTTSTNPPPGGQLQNAGKWGFPGNGNSSSVVSSKWGCNLDILDFELERAYYSGRMLTFRPFMGPRLGWLKQRLTMKANDLDDDPDILLTSKNKSTSWFMGPRAGVDLRWILGWGIRLTGSTGASLLYQRQTVKSKYSDLTDPDATFKSLKDAFFRHIRPNAEMGMGLGWGTYVMNNTWHFDILAAYEFHYWWKQNVMPTANLRNPFFNRAAVSDQVLPGDLAYHGLTLTLRLDF